MTKEEVKDVIEYTIAFYEDWDANWNYSKESRQQGMEELAKEYVEKWGKINEKLKTM